MAGNGHEGRGRQHPHVAEDRSLFHQQHPSTPPPRFSSPFRLRSRTTTTELAFKTAANRAATSTLLQGIVWTVLGALAVLLHYGMLPVPDIKEDQWSRWDFTMYSIYFNDNAAVPSDLPKEGIVSATQMLYFAIVTLVANFLMFLLSFVLVMRLCCGANPRAELVAVVMWVVSVILATAVDVAVAAAMVRDLVLLQNLSDWPGDLTVLLLCPGAVLVVALRGGVLLLANVACMLLVLRRLHEHRNKASKSDAARADQPATKADGPIDGFLYRNGKEGVRNPSFVPDGEDGEDRPWTTFKPEQNEGHRANGHSGPDLGYLSRDDPEDISHLMWMEQVDKHVDVNMRRGRVEDRPPQHHRLGFIEQDRPPQHHRLGFIEQDRPPQHHRRGFVDDRYLDEHLPSGRLRAALGPLSPGPVPVGYPETGQGLRLPRAAVVAEPPIQAPFQAHSQAPFQAHSQAHSQGPFQAHSQAPALPPVDYSPPPRRRADGGAADRALAEGRANLRPVKQDRY